MLILGTHKN